MYTHLYLSKYMYVYVIWIKTRIYKILHSLSFLLNVVFRGTWLSRFSIQLLVSAQGMISGSWDGAPS